MSCCIGVLQCKRKYQPLEYQVNVFYRVLNVHCQQQQGDIRNGICKS